MVWPDGQTNRTWVDWPTTKTPTYPLRTLIGHEGTSHGSWHCDRDPAGSAPDEVRHRVVCRNLLRQVSEERRQEHAAARQMQPKRVVKTKVLWLEWRGAVTLYCEVHDYWQLSGKRQF